LRRAARNADANANANADADGAPAKVSSVAGAAL
jgi:hypothetical protein